MDADPQGTALDWKRQTPDDCDGPAVEYVNTDDSHAPYIGGADIVVIDSPARFDEQTGAVLSVSDFALVPTRPFGMGLWDTAKFLDMLKDHLSNGLKVSFVASQRDVRKTLSDELEDVLSKQDLSPSRRAYVPRDVRTKAQRGSDSPRRIR